LRRTIGRRLALLGGAATLCGAAVIEWLLRPQGAVYRLLTLTDFAMDKPRLFSPFHLICLIVCIGLALFAALSEWGRRVDRDRLLFGAGLVLLLLEVYKQLFVHALYGNGRYDFSILPLQLCSYALYVYLAIPLLPRGRVKDTLTSFAALYLTMGGCLVMAWPRFPEQGALALHSMLWHTVMIVVGVVLLRSQGEKGYPFPMVRGGGVFLAVFGLAILLNRVLTPLAEGSAGALNLFYMHPDHPCSYLIIRDAWRMGGHGAALACYALLYLTLGAHLPWGLGWLLSRRDRRKNVNKV